MQTNASAVASHARDAAARLRRLRRREQHRPADRAAVTTAQQPGRRRQPRAQRSPSTTSPATNAGGTKWRQLIWRGCFCSTRTFHWPYW